MSWLPPQVSSILRWIHLFIMDDVIFYFHKASFSNIELLTCVFSVVWWGLIVDSPCKHVASPMCPSMKCYLTFLFCGLAYNPYKIRALPCSLVCDKTCTYREAKPRVSAKIGLLIFVCPLVCEEIWLLTKVADTLPANMELSPVCLLVCEETWPKNEPTISTMLANIGLLPCVYVYWCVMRFDRWLKPLQHFLQT